MTEQTGRPSLKDFGADADRNGQDLGQDSPLDVGLAANTQADLKRDPAGDAQAARVASGTPLSRLSRPVAGRPGSSSPIDCDEPSWRQRGASPAAWTSRP